MLTQFLQLLVIQPNFYIQFALPTLYILLYKVCLIQIKYDEIISMKYLVYCHISFIDKFIKRVKYKNRKYLRIEKSMAQKNVYHA